MEHYVWGNDALYSWCLGSASEVHTHGAPDSLYNWPFFFLLNASLSAHLTPQFFLSSQVRSEPWKTTTPSPPKHMKQMVNNQREYCQMESSTPVKLLTKALNCSLLQTPAKRMVPLHCALKVKRFPQAILEHCRKETNSKWRGSCNSTVGTSLGYQGNRWTFSKGRRYWVVKNLIQILCLNSPWLMHPQCRVFFSHGQYVRSGWAFIQYFPQVLHLNFHKNPGPVLLSSHYWEEWDGMGWEGKWGWAILIGIRPPSDDTAEKRFDLMA